MYWLNFKNIFENQGVKFQTLSAEEMNKVLNNLEQVKVLTPDLKEINLDIFNDPMVDTQLYMSKIKNTDNNYYSVISTKDLADANSAIYNDIANTNQRIINLDSNTRTYVNSTFVKFTGNGNTVIDNTVLDLVNNPKSEINQFMKLMGGNDGWFADSDSTNQKAVIKCGENLRHFLKMHMHEQKTSY
mgnify:CR=1 FL=1